MVMSGSRAPSAVLLWLAGVDMRREACACASCAQESAWMAHRRSWRDWRRQKVLERLAARSWRNWRRGLERLAATEGPGEIGGEALV